MKPLAIALVFLAASTVTAEEAETETPRAAFDRMQKAEEADDYAAWGASRAGAKRGSL